MTTVTRGGTASGWPLPPALLTVDLDFRWQPHQASYRGESPFLGYLQGRRVLCAGHIRVFSLRVRQGSVHLVDAGSERHHEPEVHRRLLARLSTTSFFQYHLTFAHLQFISHSYLQCVVFFSMAN